MTVIEHLPTVAISIGILRAVIVFDGLLFMFLRSGRDIRWDRPMRIAFAEPFLLLAATSYLWSCGPLAPMTQTHAVVTAVGALFCCAGLVLFAWSLVAHRGVGTGHYVDEDHRVVDRGPYGLVRHPMYCAAIFIWLGLALANADWALLTLTFAYVVPAYYFYARKEEEMMSEALGDAYTRYATGVPMLFPRPLNIWE